MIDIGIIVMFQDIFLYIINISNSNFLIMFQDIFLLHIN
jgi:hypothetical protein